MLTTAKAAKVSKEFIISLGWHSVTFLQFAYNLEEIRFSQRAT